MNKKGIKRVITGLVTLMVALAFTVGFAAQNKQDAKACGFLDYFKRISVKKCAVTLVPDSYSWTGQECKPEVKVNYMGKDLTQGVDYVIEYRNNIDAGRATVVVKGKGDYRGTQKVNFKINGIRLDTECTATVSKGKVTVYHKGQILGENCYRVSPLEQRELVSVVEGHNGNLNTYKVTTTYYIYGKGMYEGSISVKEVTTELKYEQVQ